MAVPVLAAFLAEYLFYLVPAFAEVRRRWERTLPSFLVLSFVAPYLIYALNTGQFRWWGLVQLAALATALGLWYRILPAAPLTDGTFLVLVAAVVLRGYFDPIYTSPSAGLHVEIFGHVALTRLCAMVMLVERRVPGVDYGFIPSFAEWKIGLRHFMYFLIAGIPLAWATRLVRLGPGMPLWKVAATFLGVLWVVALSEEFFFRGLLQQWIADWTGRPAVRGLALPRRFYSAQLTLDFADSPTGNSHSPRRWRAGSMDERTGNGRAYGPAW